jgi:hypothetical protein
MMTVGKDYKYVAEYDMGGNKWNIVTISLYMKNSQHAIELSALQIWCPAMRAHKVPHIT